MLSVQLESLDSGPFNSSFDVGMHNGSVVGAFEWDTYGYFVGCNKLGAQYHCVVHAPNVGICRRFSECARVGDAWSSTTFLPNSALAVVMAIAFAYSSNGIFCFCLISGLSFRCFIAGHFPFPNYKIYYPGAVWWSLPGPCPSKNYTQWTDWCKEREPGGYCDQTPTGQGNCTWTYEDAGEITIDLWHLRKKKMDHFYSCIH